MRINQVPACRAAEQGSGNECVGVRKGVAGVDLLVEVSLAPQAVELSVEGVELVGLGRENVLVPLNRTQDISGIHLLEDTHKMTVGMVG